MLSRSFPQPSCYSDQKQSSSGCSSTSFAGDEQETAVRCQTVQCSVSVIELSPVQHVYFPVTPTSTLLLSFPSGLTTVGSKVPSCTNQVTVLVAAEWIWRPWEWRDGALWPGQRLYSVWPDLAKFVNLYGADVFWRSMPDRPLWRVLCSGLRRPIIEFKNCSSYIFEKGRKFLHFSVSWCTKNVGFRGATSLSFVGEDQELFKLWAEQKARAAYILMSVVVVQMIISNCACFLLHITALMHVIRLPFWNIWFHESWVC